MLASPDDEDVHAGMHDWYSLLQFARHKAAEDQVAAEQSSSAADTPQVAKTRVRVREMQAALHLMQALHRGEGRL